MNPRIIKLISKGHENKIKEIDSLAWLFGRYVHSAVGTAVEHCLAGRKAQSKYIEQPLLMQTELGKKEEAEQITEAEKQKQVELLFMRLQVQAHNFKQEKKKKENQGGIGA